MSEDLRIVIQSCRDAAGRTTMYDVAGNLSVRRDLAVTLTEGLTATMASNLLVAEQHNQVARTAMLLAGVVKNLNIELEWVYDALLILGTVRETLFHRRRNAILTGAVERNRASEFVVSDFAYFEYDWTSILAPLYKRRSLRSP